MSYALCSSLTEDFLDFGRQTGKNIIIGHGVVVSALFLIGQGYVDEGHQRDSMVALAALESLRIAIIALCNEFGCTAIVLLVLAIDNDFDFLIVDVQSDM